jgi:hypothetical protein
MEIEEVERNFPTQPIGDWIVKPDYSTTARHCPNT